MRCYECCLLAGDLGIGVMMEMRRAAGHGDEHVGIALHAVILRVVASFSPFGSVGEMGFVKCVSAALFVPFVTRFSLAYKAIVVYGPLFVDTVTTIVVGLNSV